ncbi:type III polyketide synthase [bacterium]|nr:MAG: type III polyketide synthase [bacterium]
MTAVKNPARIASVATALPPYRADQETASRYFRRHYGERLSRGSLAVLDKVLGHGSIRTRHFAVENPDCLVDEDPDLRVERYTRWAVNLSAEAARKALCGAKTDAEDISALVVNTCTGYLCPGLTSYLIENLGLPRDVRGYDLVGSGCGGALPALGVGRGHLASSGGAALLVSVEICSATFQVGDDRSLLVSNALFGDGAAAAVLRDGPGGLEIINSASCHMPEERDKIRYVYRGGKLHNQLSPALPGVVAGAVADVVEDMLGQAGVTKGEVAHWAFHTGGDKILGEIRERLSLREEAMAPSRRVLERCGNISSPTVWFSLRDILDGGVKPGELIAMVTFGAGLSAHGCLLRV